MSKKNVKRVLVRMPESLHASIARGADAKGQSINTYIVLALSEHDVVERVMREVQEALLKREDER